ncbi:channel protein TolC [Oxalobacteraceae bacterium CAVE-383]|nr:channel protein TolC [Oxalobacteraceae bacterium CAVE-383]
MKFVKSTKRVGFGFNFSLLLAALLAAGAAAPLPAGASDLSQIYQQALANDPTYASARYAMDAGREKAVQGRAGLLPNIAMVGAYTRSNDDLNNSSNTYALRLAQPLLRVGNWETYRQGRLAAAQSEAQFALAQQDLILRVSQAYFNVLAAQDVLATLSAQKKAIGEQLDLARRSFEAGTAMITDTHEAQARYDLIVAQEIGGVNALELARDRLQQITGAVPEQLAAVRKDAVLTPPEPAQVEQWIASAENGNIGILSQQLAVEIAQRQIKIERAGHYPSVDLVASRNFIKNDNPNGPVYVQIQSSRYYSNSIGVQWTIPLFSGFSVDSKVSESISLTDRARAELEATRRNAVLNTRQAYLGVVNGLAQIKAYQAAQTSSMSSLDSNKTGYDAGVRVNIDVLNAQQQLFASQRDLAHARYDALMSGLKLKAAAGTLQEQDLNKINALLGGPES